MNGYLNTVFLKNIEKVCFYIHNRRHFIHISSAFEVKIKTSVIQVYSADHGSFIVGYKILCMDKAVIFIYFDSQRNKLFVVRFCNGSYIPFIGYSPE